MAGWRVGDHGRAPEADALTVRPPGRRGLSNASPPGCELAHTLAGYVRTPHLAGYVRTHHLPHRGLPLQRPRRSADSVLDALER
jgi:hypothetical protein